jgi:hypothetical protein
MSEDIVVHAKVDIHILLSHNLSDGRLGCLRAIVLPAQVAKVAPQTMHYQHSQLFCHLDFTALKALEHNPFVWGQYVNFWKGRLSFRGLWARALRSPVG